MTRYQGKPFSSLRNSPIRRRWRSGPSWANDLGKVDDLDGPDDVLEWLRSLKAELTFSLLVGAGSGLLSAWVFSANVRCKFLIGQRFKVTHHCVERFADRRVSRVEDLCTLGTAPTTKARLVYPHQLARHGRIIFRIPRKSI
jgi:hypothetical protein